MFFNIFPFSDISFYDKHYDQSANLLYLESSQLNNYFDFIFKSKKTHPVEYSIEYAIMLLKRNHRNDVKRAHDILNTVITFQDTNKQHETFGTIPTYAEAPITEHFSQSFDLPNNGMICIALLQTLEYFPSLLSDEITEKIKTTCYNIAFHISLVSLSFHTPVSHSKLIFVYILLKCGQLFDNTDFTTLAEILFNDFYSGTLYNGGLWEYNSSAETYYTSELLTMIKRILSNPGQIEMVDTLYDLLWKNIAENFHSKMMLLTGPQSDSSKEIPAEQFYTFIKIAIGKNPNIPESYIPVLSRCPNKYIFHFQTQQPDKFIQKLVSHGSTNLAFFNSKIATNYIQPNYSLGSFNCCEFWLHHKPLIGYFTSDDNKYIYKFGIKVLLNGYDFSSGKLNSVQHKGCVLGHISFLTNRGDRHLNLTTTNGIVKTNDFRIRFFIEGNTKNLHIMCSDKNLKVIHNNTVINYSIPFIQIDNHPVRFNLETKKDCVYFDAIIVENEEKEINLKKLNTAICQFVIQASSANDEIIESSYNIEDDRLIGNLSIEGYNLKLESFCKPDYYEYKNSNDRQYINDKSFSAHTAFNSYQTSLYSFMTFKKSNYSMFSHDSDENSLNDFQHISETETKNLSSFVTSLLNKIRDENYTLGIFKRYSVQIVKALFNNVTEKNFQFTDIINNSYFDIYQRISNAPSYDMVYAIILETVDELTKELIFSEQQVKKQNIVSNVISIIEKNYHDSQLSLTTISQMLGVSESYICREFKKKTNATYAKYLTRVRMEKAKNLLANGITPESITELCGYTNISGFRYAFKKYTGMTLSSWMDRNNLK